MRKVLRNPQVEIIRGNYSFTAWSTFSSWSSISALIETRLCHVAHKAYVSPWGPPFFLKFIMCMSVLLTYMSTHYKHSGPCWDQKRTTELLRLELRRIVSWQVVARNQIQVFCKSTQCSYNHWAISPALEPTLFVIYQADFFIPQAQRVSVLSGHCFPLQTSLCLGAAF